MTFQTSEAPNLWRWSCCSSNLPWWSLHLESPLTPGSSLFHWSQPHQASEEPCEAALTFIQPAAAPAVVPWWKEPVQVRLHSNDEGNLPGNASCVVNSAVTLPLPTNTENISNRFAFLLWVMGDLTPYQILPLEIRFYSHTQEKIKKENVSKGPFIKDLFAAWKTYP